MQFCNYPVTFAVHPREAEEGGSMRTQGHLRLIGIILVLFLFAATAPAQTARKPIFVSPEQLDAASVLLNPPANDSDQTRVEVAELHRIQEMRSAPQVLHAQKDDAEEDIFIFKDVLGEKFNREALPMMGVLSDHVHNDEGFIVNPAKAFFRRPRPYHFDETLKPVCKVTDNRTDYAYPSGHGTTGYLEGLVLTLIIPEKRDAILARADDYAHSRLVCGVHYPSDVVVSKYVAYAMVGIMMNNAQFKKELAAAKSETRSLLGLQSSN
jgi:acid phosphatase (class A)